MTQILTLLFFPFLMAFAGASDLFSMKISNKIPIMLVLCFFITAILAEIQIETITYHILCALSVLLVTFCMFALGWVGGGDAKLIAATSLWFGLSNNLLNYFIIATLIGGLLTIAIMNSRRHPLPWPLSGSSWIVRLHDMNSGIPYGLALAAAALIVYPETGIWLAAMQV
jgi:prepilin peptidase CpaA